MTIYLYCIVKQNVVVQKYRRFMLFQVIEFKRKRAFLPFVKRVSEARRLAAMDESKALLALLFKLMGNAAYGSSIIDYTRFSKVTFVHGRAELSRAVNSPHFINFTQLTADYYEVESKYKMITLNMPIQIGFFILQNAKLRMNSFFYDFIMKVCDRSKFVLCQSDTDSMYLAIAGSQLSDIVKPEEKAHYDNMLMGHCCDLENENVTDRFLCRTCCEKHNIYDRKLPGVNKIEYEGTECISLCSKTYIVLNDDGYKLTAKGVNKELVSSPYKKMRRALDDRVDVSVTNTGIRTFNSTMYTYTQNRIGFSSWYCKRVVQPDFVSTKPLSITLKPIQLVECSACSELTADVRKEGDVVLCLHCANFLEFCDV